MDKIHLGFIPQETEPEHYELGSGKLTGRYGARTLMPGGKGWQQFLPKPENQSNRALEPMDCTVATALHGWETVANKLKADGLIAKEDFPEDCSERFSAILAKITYDGGSGVVIIRYPTASASKFSCTGGSTTTTGSDTVCTFTSNGTFTYSEPSAFVMWMLDPF